MNRNKQMLLGGLFLALLVGVLHVAGFSDFGTGVGGMSLAALPFMGLRFLSDSEPGLGGGGTATLPEGEFQKRVLDAVGGIKKKHEELETNFASLDKEAKRLSEDLSKHVKSFEGLPGQVADFTKTLQKIELKIAAEKRASFGSAADALQDPELNLRVNAIVRGTIAAKNQLYVPMNEAQRKSFEDFQQRAVTTGASPGSTYIDDALVTTIYSLIAEHGVWRGFDVIPASTKTTKLIVDSTDPDMGFVAEGSAPSEGSYSGAQPTATVKKMLGWIGVSNEMLEDSEIDLSGHILSKYARSTAKRLDHISIVADGTNDAANGEFDGIFSVGTAAVAAGGNTSVENLDFEDFLKVLTTVNASVLSRPARWWLHPQILVRMLAVKDLNGRPIFLPAIDAPAPGALGSILGYPVTLSHVCPTTNTASSKVAAFGDPMGNAVLLRKDFQFAASDQVLFKEDQTVFRARARAASKVKQSDAFAVLTLAAS